MKSENRKRKRTVGILGYGNMGQAILSLFLTRTRLKTDFNLTVCSLGVDEVPGARCVKSIENLFAESDLIFICIKPQEFYQLKPFGRDLSEDKPVISIMAGISIAKIQKIFLGAKVMRVMPNLPLRVGKGVIGWYSPKQLFNLAEQELFAKIFPEFGLSVPLQDERQLDAITAISGSGPAYVFLFANALVKVAEKIGFDHATAKKIVGQTITGSLAYADSQTEDFNELIAKVKSKGGTTEAALGDLGVADYYERWQSAVQSAYRRSIEISDDDTKSA